MKKKISNFSILILHTMICLRGRRFTTNVVTLKIQQTEGTHWVVYMEQN